MRGVFRIVVDRLVRLHHLGRGVGILPRVQVSVVDGEIAARYLYPDPMPLLKDDPRRP